MKKFLLGAFLVVSAMSYAQTNRVIEELVGGKAEVAIPVTVVGEVHDTAKTSLVVEVESANSAAGLGFGFEMPALRMGEAPVTANGLFSAYLVQGDNKVEFNKAPVVKLAKAGNLSNTQTTKTDAADLKYSLAETQSNANIYRGTLTVEATPIKVGTYSDNSVQLSVVIDNN
ncbi:MAG: hypothetical protein ACRC51_08855 [Cetobacterium sp.]